MSVLHIYPEWRIEFLNEEVNSQVIGGSIATSIRVNGESRLRWLKYLSRILADIEAMPVEIVISSRSCFGVLQHQAEIRFQCNKPVMIDEPSNIREQLKLGSQQGFLYKHPETKEPLVIETSQGLIKLKAPKAFGAVTVLGSKRIKEDEASAAMVAVPPKHKRKIEIVDPLISFKERLLDVEQLVAYQEETVRSMSSELMKATSVAYAPFIFVAAIVVLCFLAGGLVTLVNAMNGVTPEQALERSLASGRKQTVIMPDLGDASISIATSWQKGRLHYELVADDTSGSLARVLSQPKRKENGAFFAVWEKNSDSTQSTKLALPFAKLKLARQGDKIVYVVAGDTACTQAAYQDIYYASGWSVGWND